MQVVGTREAFMALVKQPGFAAMSGMRKDLVSLWASGKRVPSLDKMEEVLLQAGASVVSEKVWEVATPHEINRSKLEILASEYQNVIDKNLHKDVDGKIKVYPYYNSPDPDLVKIEGVEYKITCSLDEKTHGLVTDISGGKIGRVKYLDNIEYPLDYPKWINQIKEAINNKDK